MSVLITNNTKSLTIQLPKYENCCSVCLEEFNGNEIKPVDLQKICRNHGSISTIESKLELNYCAAFLRDPTMKMFQQVCTTCFEKMALLAINDCRNIVQDRDEIDEVITLSLLCPVCKSKKKRCEIDIKASLWFDENIDNTEYQEKPEFHGVDTDKLTSLLSPDVATSVVNALTKEYETRTRSIFYCPVKGCGRISKCDKNIVDCTDHGPSCCFCMERILESDQHECKGLPNDFFCENEDDDNDYDETCWIENCKRCPHCITMIERNQGCELVFCTNCNKTFNWHDQPTLSSCLKEKNVPDNTVEQDNPNKLSTLKEVWDYWSRTGPCQFPVNLIDDSPVWQPKGHLTLNFPKTDVTLSLKEPDRATENRLQMSKLGLREKVQQFIDSFKSEYSAKFPRLEFDSEVLTKIYYLHRYTNLNVVDAIINLANFDGDLSNALYVYCKEDIDLIISQTNCTKHKAVIALCKTEWDIVNAIMLLVD